MPVAPAASPELRLPAGTAGMAVKASGPLSFQVELERYSDVAETDVDVFGPGLMYRLQ